MIMANISKIKINGKVGYKNDAGDIVVEPIYDEVQELTDTYFAVEQNNLWGVIDAVSGDFIISCEYDSLVYEGKDYIYLNKGDLWGAKTILAQNPNGKDVPYSFVDIPLRFKEIKELDYAHEHIFGVRLELERGLNGYTIINARGLIYHKYLIREFDKQCEIYDNNLNRILAVDNGKFGFINAKGCEVIPFQYDEVQRRSDGLFDVRIENAWGVLDMESGREIVNVKYSKQIPLEFENEIVKNAATGRYGILSKDGSEKVPSIYEHLKVDDDVLFFGYAGWSSEYTSNFFDSELNEAIWGVIDKTGREVIPALYDCFIIQGDFLIAGRDGEMIGSGYSDDENSYYSDYDGIYDLYTKSGELILGGFSEFYYDINNEVYIFFIGGKFVEQKRRQSEDPWSPYYDEHFRYYTYERDNGAWLFLDKNLKSLIKDSKGNQMQFHKGFKCCIENVLDKNNQILLRNIPNEISSKGLHSIVGDNLIIGDCFRYAEEDGVYYKKYSTINMATGEQTPYYEHIEPIGKPKHILLTESNEFMKVKKYQEICLQDELFYFSEGGKVGVRNYKEVILPAEYLFISNPVDGFYLAAKEIDGENSCLTLFSFNDYNFKLVIIPKILTSELIKATKYIPSEVEAKNVDKTILAEYTILAQAYIDDASSNNPYWSFAKINYFTDDYRLRKDTYCSRDYYGDYDRPDYAGDTWDAMTDGMYGDMPDGFDGDYSFLGR